MWIVSIYFLCWQIVNLILIVLLMKCYNFYIVFPLIPFVLGKQLWKRFRGEDKPPAHLGSSRDYNVDMVPKVLSPPLDQIYPCTFFIVQPHNVSLFWGQYKPRSNLLFCLIG
jgi:hypothetical protein